MELTSTLQTLEAKIGGAPNSTNPTYVCSYIDTYFQSGKQIPGSKTGSLNGATAVVVCAAPEPDFVSRKITSLVIYNADDASVTLTVQKDIDSTEYGVVKATMAAGYALVYDGSGFQVSPAETSDSDSKATSNSTVISTNLSNSTSRVTSNSTLISGNTSRTLSNSLNASVADSKAVSVSVISSANLSTGDSKAASNSLVTSTADSKAVSNGLLASANASAILSAHP